LASPAKDTAKPKIETMQISYLINVDIQDYRENYKQLIDRPLSCPYPHCLCPKPPNRHGTYPRGLIIDLLAEVNCCYFRPRVIDGKKVDESIPILRFLCKKCNKTISILPSFAVFFKHYSSDSICACLHEIYHLGHSLERISADGRAIPVRTIREWKEHWTCHTPLLFQDGLGSLGFTAAQFSHFESYEQLVYNALAASIFPSTISGNRNEYCKVFSSIQPELGKSRIGIFRPLPPIYNSA